MGKRIVNLAVGTLALMFLGLLYAWSVFVKPLETALGFNPAETANIFTVSMIAFCLGGVLGGILQKKIKPRLLMIGIAVVLAAGFVLSSTVTQIFEIYLYYGVFCGLAVGVGYNVILSVIVKWFPEKASLVSGIMLMGFGAGGFLLSASANAIINTYGIRSAFIIIGAAGGVLMFLASFFILNPKDAAAKKTGASSANDVDTRGMLKKCGFWTAYSWAVVTAGIGLAIIGKASPIAQETGLSPDMATVAVGAISVLNGIGRILTGALYPKMSFKKLMGGVCVIFFAAVGLILISVTFANQALVFPGFVLLGLAYGAVPSFMVCYIRTFFGPKNYPVNMSVANTSLIFSALLGSSLLGYLTSATATYTYTLITTLAIAAVGFLLPLTMQRDGGKSH